MNLQCVLYRMLTKKATHEELLELLQHKWKLQHPESVLIKQGEESGKHY
ncbi:hypothetical protein H6B28_16250 [Bacteroides mediterraneensis]|nr:hypothetical protein [Bacteroides mediterraneensis]